MNPHTPANATLSTRLSRPGAVLPGALLPGDPLYAALTRVGTGLAVRSRREQGLPPHVEDAEAAAGFVELWQRPRPHRTGDSDTSIDSER